MIYHGKAKPRRPYLQYLTIRHILQPLPNLPEGRRMNEKAIVLTLFFTPSTTDKNSFNDQSLLLYLPVDAFPHHGKGFLEQGRLLHCLHHLPKPAHGDGERQLVTRH